MGSKTSKEDVEEKRAEEQEKEKQAEDQKQEAEAQAQAILRRKLAKISAQQGRDHDDIAAKAREEQAKAEANRAIHIAKIKARQIESHDWTEANKPIESARIQAQEEELLHAMDLGIPFVVLLAVVFCAIRAWCKSARAAHELKLGEMKKALLETQQSHQLALKELDLKDPDFAYRMRMLEAHERVHLARLEHSKMPWRKAPVSALPDFDTASSLTPRPNENASSSGSSNRPHANAQASSSTDHDATLAAADWITDVHAGDSESQPRNLH